MQKEEWPDMGQFLDLYLAAIWSSRPLRGGPPKNGDPPNDSVNVWSVLISKGFGEPICCQDCFINLFILPMDRPLHDTQQENR